MVLNLKPEFQKNLLLDKLKENGYKIVRFYESIDDFKNDKNSFKTLNLDNLNNEVKNNIKLKISWLNLLFQLIIIQFKN